MTWAVAFRLAYERSIATGRHVYVHAYRRWDGSWWYSYYLFPVRRNVAGFNERIYPAVERDA